MVETEEKKEHYSFSKLSSFHTCKYGYKLTYIDHIKGCENAFALYGSLVHSIMERYAKGNIELWDLSDVYKTEFDEQVNLPFPNSVYCKDMKHLYYSQGLDFLETFPGYEKYKILEVETEFELPIEDWIFTGIMDLLYEDENGRLILLDYKSKSGFKNKEEKHKYARQLYLYCLYIKEKYGKYPDLMIFWTFRKKKQIEIPFNEDDLLEALNWAKFTVKKIRECKDFSPCCDEFFGNELCNHRKTCKLKNY